MNALELKNISKTYTHRIKKPGMLGTLMGLVWAEKRLIPAVQELSFSIKPGEAVGLIGENGAGKSTTMKLCTGILKPSGGDIKILGYSPFKQRRQLALNIGVVFGQRPQLLWDIAVRETFELCRTMYAIPKSTYADTLSLCANLLELNKLLDTPVRQLSLGQRMRCDLACAFLHAPQVIFLDEPTIGLDVLAKEQARQLIKAMLARYGSTLILTTHDLKDITETCKRVILLDKGKKLFDGSLKAFERTYARERRAVVDLERKPSAATVKLLERELKRLKAKLSWPEPYKAVITYSGASSRPIAQVVLKRLAVADMAFEKAEIEAVVRKIYQTEDAKHG